MISKIDFKIIFVIVLLSFIFWKHIPSLQFVGEGFTYFLFTQGNYSFSATHDVFARFIFFPLTFLFQEKVYFYMLFMFIYMIFTFIVIYLVIKMLTKNRLSAFLVTIFFGLSEVAQYDMYSSGGYQYFIQRGALLFPLVISFGYMVSYFKDGFIGRNFMISFVLFNVSIILGFFSTWMLPLFIFYPLTYMVINLRKKGIKILRFIWIPTIYCLVNYSIIRSSSFARSEISPVGMLINQTILVFGSILHQFNAIVLPADTYMVVLGAFNRFDTHHNISLTKFYLGIFLLLIHFSVLFIALKKKIPHSDLIIASFVSLFSMLFLNTYINSSNVNFSFASSRYFNYPFFVYSIFIGLIFSYFYKQTNKWLKPFLYLYLIIFFTANYLAILRTQERDASIHRANKQTILILDKNKESLLKYPSYVILPSSFGAYGGEYVKKFYMNPDGKVFLENLVELNLSDIRKKDFNAENFYYIHYDSVQERIVDLTTITRKGLLAIPK